MLSMAGASPMKRRQRFDAMSVSDILEEIRDHAADRFLSGKQRRLAHLRRHQRRVDPRQTLFVFVEPPTLDDLEELERLLGVEPDRLIPGEIITVAEPVTESHPEPAERERIEVSEHLPYRSETIGNYRRLTRAEKQDRVEYPSLALYGPRPQTRKDCEPGGCNEERPCPWVSCKWHLYANLTPLGSLQLNFPDLPPEEMRQSCTLDIADHGGVMIEEVAGAIGLTRQRIHQMENEAAVKLKSNCEAMGIDVAELLRGESDG